jgi:class 3 adenylate cyclase
MDPGEVFAFLNDYVAAVAPIAEKHGGFILHVIGDKVVLLFPEMRKGGAEDALSAAVAMHRRLLELSEKQKARGCPEVRAGMGLASGALLLGAVGEAGGVRMTAAGEAMGLSARMERLSSIYGTRIVAADEIRAAIHGRNFQFRELDKVRFPGASGPCTAWEVYNADPEDLRQAKQQSLEVYNSALSAFRSRRWTEAAAGFEKTKRFLPSDRAAEMYLARSLAYARNPPPDTWEGITRLSDL